MREIIFRGKRIDNGEWVEGFYTCFNGKEHRIYSGYAETDCGDYYPDWDNIDPETIGEYTGLTDSNGKKIFEGDIIKSGSYEFLVSHGKCGGCDNTDNYGYIGFHLEPANEETKLYMGYGLRDDICYYTEAEVIGNIHDNPELLKGGEE